MDLLFEDFDLPVKFLYLKLLVSDGLITGLNFFDKPAVLFFESCKFCRSDLAALIGVGFGDEVDVASGVAETVRIFGLGHAMNLCGLLVDLLL
jgi:hypothetical protein